MADFGVDISAYPDYDALGTLVSGNIGLAQRVARRLTNPRGAWFWAPNECTDVRAFLNELLTQERQASIKNDVEREVLREEQVLSATAEVSINPLSNQGQTITVKVLGNTRDGPFKFVLQISAVTLAVLQAG